MSIFNFKTEIDSAKNTEKLYASSRSYKPAGTKVSDGRYVSAEELYSFIAEYLSKSLGNYNFKYLKSKHAFKRITERGCDMIDILFNDHVHYHVHFFFSKRIDNLQKIITTVNYENGFNTINNYKEQYTVSVDSTNIMGNSIEIVSYAVLEKELPRILLLIENDILPYFDKLNSVDFVHQTLNYPEKDKKNYFSLHTLNGFATPIIDGLIVAKLLNDINYEKLCDEYIKKYSENMVLKEKIIKLNKYLENKKISL